MFKNILVNTPAWPAEWNTIAVDVAANIAKQNSAAIKVFDVRSDTSWIMQYISGGWEDTLESLTGSKRKRLHEVAESLTARGIEASSAIAKGRLSTAIIREVREHNHDLVVKTAEATSNRSGIIGSTDMRLIHDCPCATLILRPDGLPGFQNVVVAADVLDEKELQQDLDRRAIAVAASLVEKENSVALVYALPPIKSAIQVSDENEDVVTDEQLEKWDRELNVAAEQKLSALSSGVRGKYESRVLHGDPTEAIPEFANSSCADLLVIGSVARKGLEGFFLGNTAERILERVNCSVLVLKPKQNETEPV